ncbi:MAG: CPBP family intramembrane glutamic endopeptidase, partial [Spirochaetales bacterium]
MRYIRKSQNQLYPYPLPFLFLTLGISWLFWSVAVLMQVQVHQTLGRGLLTLGGLGPTLATLGFLFLSGETRTDFLRRLLWVRGGSFGIWLLILLLPLGIQLLSIVGSLGLGASKEQLCLREDFHSLNQLVLFAGFIFLFGPLPEEVGWRGYGLPALLNRLGWVPASILLACFWALWHLPLFFIGGYPLAILTQEPLRLLFYFLDFFPNTLLYSWIFLLTGGSIPAAVVFHWSGNFWGMAFETGPLAEGFALGIKTILALLIATRIPMQKS